MKKINSLNNYLGENRKYLLISLNVLLIVFVVLEIYILANLRSKFEIQTAGTEYCRTCGQKDGNFSKGW
tara:strand:- start:305 stop:511 length:207 start_codon:yes stop_codon:yes gene_type:complete